MHFVIAPMAVARDRIGDPAWRRVDGAEPALMRLFGLQTSMLLAATLVVVWAVGTNFRDLPLRYWTVLAAAVLVVPLHELAHALTFPRGANSRQRTLLIRPRGFVFRAQYRGVLSRNRYVLVLLMPFLAISLAPVLACALLGIESAPTLFIVLMTLNALASGDDVLAAVLVLSQVPARGLVRTDGSATLWKPAVAPVDARKPAG